MGEALIDTNPQRKKIYLETSKVPVVTDGDVYLRRMPTSGLRKQIRDFSGGRI